MSAGVPGLSPLADLRGVEAFSTQQRYLLAAGGSLVFSQDCQLVVAGESPALRAGSWVRLGHASILGASVQQSGRE
jgi:hypothetical protein